METKIESKVKIGLIIAILLGIWMIPLFAQCNRNSMHKQNSHFHKESTNQQVIDSTNVRTGIIDLEGIDKNRDGYVYQDEMHFNVISDTASICPFPDCKMPLRKVTIEEARQSLEENGFKVK